MRLSGSSDSDEKSEKEKERSRMHAPILSAGGIGRYLDSPR